MTSRRWLILALAVTAVILLAGRALATLYVDYQWFGAMGADSLWRAQTLTMTTLRVLSAVAGTLLVFVNLFAVRYSVISLVLPRRVGNLEIGEEVPGRYLMWAVIALSLVFGLLLAFPHENWTTAFAALAGQPFRETDPYIQADVGFFVYWLPFETSLYIWALIAVLLVSALVVFLYALTPSLRWERGTVHASNYVRRHLTVLGALLMLLLAWSYRIDAYEVIAKGHGAQATFTSLDHRVTIPGNLFLSWLTAAGAALVVIFSWHGQTRSTFVIVSGVIVMSLLVRQAGPAIARQLAEPADPLLREQPYDETRRLYTMQAFATDQVTVVDSTVMLTDVSQVVRGTPIWDPAALLRAIDRGGRDGSPSGQVGWQESPAGLLAIVPRRASPGGDADAGVAVWGVIRVLAFDADERGGYVSAQQAGLVGEDPTVSDALVSVAASGYLVVGDSLDAIPAPGLDSGLSRLAHAWSLQNFRLLFGDLPHPNPSIVRRRDVRERVRALAPFFTQGTAVTPLLHADSLLWAVELYSTSAHYPLSHHVSAGGRERGYYRYAATALVYAATGRVVLVADTALDPIGRTWRMRFPRLFTPAAELPPALRASLPPPVDGARAQAGAFLSHGSRRTAAPGLQLAWDSGADSALAGGPEPLLLLGSDAVLAWTAPVLDTEDRLAGLVLATGGADRRLMWLAFDEPGSHWSGALGRLRESVDTSLLETDPPVLRGRVRVIPATGSVLLAQPAYSWRPGAVPTLREVSVLVDDVVRTGRTLAAAVDVTLAPPAIPAPLPVEFRQRVSAFYEAMRSAMRRSDWAAFGAAFDSLGALLSAPR